MSARRRQVVVALARQAEALAREQGETVSEAAQRELEGTLEAALADTDAAEALASGRLTAALHYTGLGGTDVSDAVALPAARRVTGKVPASTREPSVSVRDAAKALVAAAQRDLAAAQEAAGSAEDAFREATQTREGISERVRQLERELATTREREERTAQRAREAEQARDTARRVLRHSLDTLKDAQADLDRLDQRDGDVCPTSER